MFMSTVMDTKSAIEAFSALAQPTRLEAVRLLVRAGENGLAAGEVAARLGVRHNLMSNHFNILVRAELLKAERRGRSIVYCARFDTLRDIIGFLMTDCCSGLPEIVEGLENEALLEGTN